MKEHCLTLKRRVVASSCLCVVLLAPALAAQAQAITGFTPVSGTAGDAIAISGSNLTGATGIRFAGTANNVVMAGYTVNAAGTQISGIVVPGGAHTGALAVSTPGGTASSAQSFTVIATWTGAVSTDWATPGNWQSGVVPTIADQVLVGSAARNPVVSGTQVAAILEVAGTGTVTIADNSSLSLYGDVPEGDGQAGLALLLRGTVADAVLAQPTGLRNGLLRFMGANRQKIDARTGTPYNLGNVYVGTAGAQIFRVSAHIRGVLTLVGDLDASYVVVAQNGQPVVLQSDASGTALVVNAGGRVLGAVAMQRYIDPAVNSGAGYRHVSSPVDATSLADLATPGFTPVFNSAYNTSATPGTVTPFPTVFGYNQGLLFTAANNLSAFDKGWFSPADASNQPRNMIPGVGYSVQLPATETVDFMGTLNTGTYSMLLGRDPDPEAGWALVGNPYPAPLDYSLVAPADRTNLDAAIYVFESTGPYSGTYRSYVNGVGNPIMASNQGFFVRVSQGHNSGTLIFRDSQRLTQLTPAPFRRGTADFRPQVRLALAGATGPADALTVYLQAGATPGADAQFDAVKRPNTTGLNLAAVAATGEELAIDGRPVLGASAALVPLAVAVPAAGTYYLRLQELLNLPATTGAVLVDNLTGQHLNLGSLPAAGYAFPVTAAQAAAGFVGRFFLYLNPAASPLATAPAALAAGVLLYPNPAQGSATVLIPAGATANSAALTLVDALGRTVQMRRVNLVSGGARAVLDLAGLPRGVYAVLVRVGSDTVTNRLVVE